MSHGGRADDWLANHQTHFYRDLRTGRRQRAAAPLNQPTVQYSGALGEG